MKKVILILIIVMSKLPIYAQLDKKTWLFGGSGSFSSTVSTITYTSNVLSPTRVEGDVDKYRINYLNISPSLGYFLFEKFAIGLKPTINWSKITIIDNNKSAGSVSSRDFLIGPYVRYYFLKKDKPFNFLIESSYQLGFVKDLNIFKGTTNNLSILAGTSLYFNKTVGLEFLLGYNRFFKTNKIESIEAEFPSHTQSFLQKGLQFNIGLQFHLEKK